VRHVRNHRGVKVAGGYPALHQPVGGRLQDAVGQPRAHHLRQVALDIGRFRGGDVEAGIQHALANLRANRGNHPDADASAAQDVVNHGGRGSFAVRARHADHAQLARRKVVQGGGQIGDRRVDIPGDLQVGRVQAHRGGKRAHHRRRAVGQRLRDVVVAVGALAFYRGEQPTRPDCARIHADAADADGRDCGCRESGHALEQRLEISTAWSAHHNLGKSLTENR